MTAKEMLDILKGPKDRKIHLFNELSSRVLAGEALLDDEIPVFETLRKELTSTAVVVNMEASLSGVSKIQS